MTWRTKALSPFTQRSLIQTLISPYDLQSEVQMTSSSTQQPAQPSSCHVSQITFLSPSLIPQDTSIHSRLGRKRRVQSLESDCLGSNLGLALTSCVTLGELLNLSEL